MDARVDQYDITIEVRNVKMPHIVRVPAYTCSMDMNDIMRQAAITRGYAKMLQNTRGKDVADPKEMEWCRCKLRDMCADLVLDTVRLFATTDTSCTVDMGQAIAKRQKERGW